MNTVLPTKHNLYWHKERLFLLKAMIGYQKFNLGQLIEREILACARRSSGLLFYPNLIRLLCEAKNVPRFDQEEKEFALEPEVILSCEEESKEKEKKEEEVRQEKKAEASNEKKEEEARGTFEVVLLLQNHILKQEAVWVFLKAAHE